MSDNSALEKFQKATAAVPSDETCLAFVDPDHYGGLLLDGWFSPEDLRTLSDAYEQYLKDVGSGGVRE